MNKASAKKSFPKPKLAEDSVKGAHPAHDKGSMAKGVKDHKATAVEPTGGKHGHGLQTKGGMGLKSMKVAKAKKK